MEVLIKGQIMEVLINEYDYNGMKGTSYKLAVYSNGKIYNVGIKENEVDSFNNIIGEEIEVRCSIYIKGSYNLKLMA